ncbi:DsbA family protein [Enterobacter hormaechei]|nr:DsbA family protein [Enterobacter hormaechei]
MQISFLTRFHRRMLGPLTVVVLSLLLVTTWYMASRTSLPAKDHTEDVAAQQYPRNPPWRYGQADARFTLVLYADLECQYCRRYYPVLKAWVDQHPETNLQWHHLPLPMHEPAASRQAQLAECVGESRGQAAFWQAVTWIYQQTRGDGAGLPESISFPALTPAIQLCLNSPRPKAIVQEQASEGARDGVTATPTLKLSDNQNNRTLVLPGPVEGDALLSALDLLSADSNADQAENTEMSADVVSDMPR